MKIHFELTTPERNVLREEVDRITLPTKEGEITILSHHVPLVALLVPGMVTLGVGNEEQYLAVSGGFIEVQENNHVVVLADTAERADELDLQKIETARDLAKKLLEEKRHGDDVSSTSATALLERELARIKVVRHHRSKRSHI